MKISEWLTNKMISLSLALHGVEKNALGQSNGQLDGNTAQEQRHTQGQLADSLKHGEATQEVLNLRWRTYKILQACDGLTAEIVGYDDDGIPIVKTHKRNKKQGLKKVNQDSFDNYQLEMVVDNSEIVSSGNEAFDNNNINVFNEAIINKNDHGDIVSATHGEITGSEYFATYKSDNPIIIERKDLPTFLIENFTKKLHIRKINETDKLLEFYVSKYPDEYNRTSRLFISELKKIIDYGKKSTLLDILGVSFITHKTIGVDDFLAYKYDIKSFDKIIEYNGHYVIKFKGNVIVNGNNILEDRRVIKLDEKYKNKEKK